MIRKGKIWERRVKCFNRMKSYLSSMEEQGQEKCNEKKRERRRSRKG